MCTFVTRQNYGTRNLILWNGRFKTCRPTKMVTSFSRSDSFTLNENKLLHMYSSDLFASENEFIGEVRVNNTTDLHIGKIPLSVNY